MTRRAFVRFVAGVALITTVGCSRPTVVDRHSGAVAPMGTTSAPGTSERDLEQTMAAMESRLASSPADAAAAVRLADAQLRLARVNGNAGLAVKAERTLRVVLNADPDRYDARRMLATVLLSQHRFREAIREAERCQQMRPDDNWPLGVIGDGHLELGEYDAAFDAFDRMVSRRPDASSYARASYARELQGDLRDAVRLMTMALEATSPNDTESLAWHHAQLGHLYLTLNRRADAAREFAHAGYVFPDHPLALEGSARLASIEGRHDAALALAERLIARAPTPAALALAADELRALGRMADAERREALAEAAWRTDAPDPAKLALFLATRERVEGRIDEAVRLAEAAAKDRDDIFTADALAWAYFRAGRLEDAAAASARAMRTGIQDRDIRARAAAIGRGTGLISTDSGRLGTGLRGLSPERRNLWK